METKKDLLDMTQEEVNKLTDDQVMDYLRQIDLDAQRIREEIRQLKKEQEEHEKRMAEYAARREKNRLKIEAARKRAESTLSI